MQFSAWGQGSISLGCGLEHISVALSTGKPSEYDMSINKTNAAGLSDIAQFEQAISPFKGFLF